MANFSWEAVVSVYGIAVLIAKMYAVVFLTGYARAKSQVRRRRSIHTQHTGYLAAVA